MTAAGPFLEVRLRDMTRADERAVRRLERAAYGPHPPGTPFERELRNELAHYVVAVLADPRDADEAARGRSGIRPRGWFSRWLGGRDADGGVIVGFAGAWFLGDQLHLTTIAVEPALQGRGIASSLLQRVFELALDAEMRTVALEVRASNHRAQRLYEWFGFQRAGTRRRYYSDNGEDALVMVTAPLDTPDMVSRLARIRARSEDRAAAETPRAGSD